MTYAMPSLTKKIIRGKPYYYLRESKRVDGKPKIVSTIYLGPPQRLLDRLLRPEPARVALHEFGASAAGFALAQALDVVATIDRHVPKRGAPGISVFYEVWNDVNGGAQSVSSRRLDPGVWPFSGGILDQPRPSRARVLQERRCIPGTSGVVWMRCPFPSCSRRSLDDSGRRSAGRGR